ncbi:MULTISPECIES: efflux RND transporter periplasmic adaptor subunit [Cellvibrio]|uniref:RND family efflux transporter MFP subunit n=1 Tax=Cellvibrio fibrivorans TaxID=126350 RepID=A0ABU1UXB8_9GAMM|nr:efflux RND transporter periplasmic adaptor subunit [Cellvibrio fibrivorans]MDR7089767.1 RND family efflux transporter MFP subunit [Cellvibrio fibrivorans]
MRISRLYITLLAATALLTQLAMSAEISSSKALSSNDKQKAHASGETQHGNASSDKSVIDDRAEITVSDQQQKAAGVQTQIVTREKLFHKIRTVGSITTDQTREAHVHTRISGWIEKIHIDYVGKAVTKGAPLFDLYSPDLVSTQEEYLAARRQGSGATEVAEAALTRLRLWGVAEVELQRLRSAKTAKKALTFYAPVTGVVIRKAAILGTYVTPDTELYYLADIAQVWLLLTLYEADVALIKIGDKVAVSLPYDLSKHYTGVISYVYPEIDIQTRTAKARVEIANADQFLRPGMFANADIEKQLTEQLVVPDEAVLDTGQRKIVFVKTGDIQFIPREVKIGQRVGDQLTILAGLNEGEAVVVSASFLIDAESRLQAALRKGTPAAGGHGGHGDNASDTSKKPSNNSTSGKE